MTHFIKPIYITRKDTFLANDYIIPYGDRIRISSESKKKAITLKLLGAIKVSKK